MDRLIQDVRYGLRQMVRHRSFSAIVVLTLGLGIGVNALIFSFADLVVFRPLPIRDIETAASIWMTHAERGDERVQVSYPDFLEWREEADSFSQLTARTYRSYNMTGVEEPTRVRAAQATASLFDVWGLGAVHGRVFTEQEDRAGAERVAVLSHGFWERQFGEQPDVLGRVVRLDGEPYTVLGVLDPAIEIGGLSEIDLWTPLTPDADPSDRERRYLRVSGRLAPGVSVEKAAAEIAAIAERQAGDHPATNAGWGVRVVPMREALMGPRAYLLIALLSLTVAFVLAIACANVANLMLARTTARSRETAVRTALGAGRRRLVRQLVTEGALLALAGGALGVGLAWAGLRVIHSTTYEPAFQFVELNQRVLLFTAAISLVTPLIFGLVPALQASRGSVVTALKEGAGRSVAGGAGKGRSALVVVQLSLALMLLVVAGLNVRAAIELQTLDMGFDRQELVTMRVDLPEAKYPEAERVRAFVDVLSERLSAAPGAGGVAASTGIPVVDGAATRSLTVLGAEARSPEASPWAAETVVTPGFFEALRIPLREGRSFTRSDGAETAPVAVVSRAFAARYLQGEALGRRIKLGGPDSEVPWREVVGVAEDLVNPNLTQGPLPQVYVPFQQRPERSLAFLVRSADAAGVIAAARAEVSRLDPDQVLWDARSFDQLMREELNFARVFTTLFAIFGLSALGLAGLGLYGVVSYGVSQRRQELGVRIALGAQRGDVLRMVVGQGAVLTAIGVALGLLGGFGMGQAMASALIVGVSPTDPVTFGGVSLALAAVSLLASYVPARRATRVDPIQALRID